MLMLLSVPPRLGRERIGDKNRVFKDRVLLAVTAGSWLEEASLDFMLPRLSERCRATPLCGHTERWPQLISSPGVMDKVHPGQGRALSKALDAETAQSPGGMNAVCRLVELSI